jgi:hypothetical protein
MSKWSFGCEKKSQTFKVLFKKTVFIQNTETASLKLVKRNVASVPGAPTRSISDFSLPLFLFSLLLQNTL